MAQVKSPVSSPDFAKMRPPRKLRSGPKSKGSAEPTPENDDVIVDFEGDAPMDEGAPSPGRHANRRSPRVAGMNPAADGVDSERTAKRQRRDGGEDQVHLSPFLNEDVLFLV